MWTIRRSRRSRSKGRSSRRLSTYILLVNARRKKVNFHMRLLNVVVAMQLLFVMLFAVAFARGALYYALVLGCSRDPMQMLRGG
jgi:hypothetical protein